MLQQQADNGRSIRKTNDTRMHTHTHMSHHLDAVSLTFLCFARLLPLQAITGLEPSCLPVSPAWKKYGKLTPREYGMVRASFRSHKE